MKPTLVVLAAGMGSRYGGVKQVDPVGPSGEAILDYSVFDAHRAGFGKVVFIIRKDFEAEFKEKVGAKYEGILPVEYCYQDINDLPAPFTVPADRAKPWGTAHAIRAARDVVKEPFAAINADDFYGRDAFAKLAAFLQQPVAADGKFHFAMVGYKLDLTLSDNGSVARGICKVEGGMLESVTEMTKLVRVPGGAENREDEAYPVKLTGEERVSMNLWGFDEGFITECKSRLAAFLDENLEKNPEKCEYLLPNVASELVVEGKADVNMIENTDKWYGVTYKEDKPEVVAAFKRLIAEGVYPENF